MFTPSLASASARCGPTPFTNWTGDSRSIAADLATAGRARRSVRGSTMLGGSASGSTRPLEVPFGGAEAAAGLPLRVLPRLHLGAFAAGSARHPGRPGRAGQPRARPGGRGGHRQGGRHVTDLSAGGLRDLRGRPAPGDHALLLCGAAPARGGAGAGPALPGAPPPPPPPTRLRRGTRRRTLALVVDDLGLSFRSTVEVRDALRKFVDEQMEPGDLVAIVRAGGGMGALQQFTADKRLLHAAIDRVRFNAHEPRRRRPVRADRRGQEPGRHPTGPARRSRTKAGAEVDALRESMLADATLAAWASSSTGFVSCRAARVSCSSPTGSASTRPRPTASDPALVRGRPGPAQLRLPSRRDRPSGRTHGSTARCGADRRRQPGIGGALQHGHPRLVHAGARRAGRRQHRSRHGGRLDWRSARAPDPTATLNRDSEWGLQAIAQETGGFLVRNQNDLTTGIERVLDDQRGYYLIGYAPDAATFKAERNVAGVPQDQALGEASRPAGALPLGLLRRRRRARRPPPRPARPARDGARVPLRVGRRAPQPHLALRPRSRARLRAALGAPPGHPGSRPERGRRNARHDARGAGGDLRRQRHGRGPARPRPGHPRRARPARAGARGRAHLPARRPSEEAGRLPAPRRDPRQGHRPLRHGQPARRGARPREAGSWRCRAWWWEPPRSAGPRPRSSATPRPRCAASAPGRRSPTASPSTTPSATRHGPAPARRPDAPVRDGQPLSVGERRPVEPRAATPAR